MSDEYGRRSQGCEESPETATLSGDMTAIGRHFGRLAVEHARMRAALEQIVENDRDLFCSFCEAAAIAQAALGHIPDTEPPQTPSCGEESP